MTDDYTPDDDDLETEGGETAKNDANMKRLRERAKAADAAEAKAEKLERELAYTKAGVPDTKLAARAMADYSGELTTEAIQAELIDLGLIEPPKEKVETIPDGEKDGLNGVREAAAGGDTVSTPGYDEELAAAKTPQELTAVLRKYKVGMAGDMVTTEGQSV